MFVSKIYYNFLNKLTIYQHRITFNYCYIYICIYLKSAVILGLYVLFVFLADGKIAIYHLQWNWMYPNAFVLPCKRSINLSRIIFKTEYATANLSNIYQFHSLWNKMQNTNFNWKCFGKIMHCGREIRCYFTDKHRMLIK